MSSPRDRKRQRSPGPSSEDEGHRLRPSQAERKRELERNRRNLVNVRFAELEAKLHLMTPRPDASGRLVLPADPPVPPPRGKRIDKEAVLKEAAHRLAAQSKDLASLGDRVSAINKEIDNLRAEKVELRADKAYLRTELDTVREEVKRLRTDNIMLWQALKKASSLKDSFAPDVAKIPAELFLRRAIPDGLASALSQPVPHASAAPAIPPRPAQPMSTPMQRHRHHQQQIHNALSSQTPSHQSSPNAQAHQSAIATDSFLVLQTPEELSEFFHMPQGMQPFGVASRVDEKGGLRNSPNLTAMGGASPPQSMPMAHQTIRNADANSTKDDPEENDLFSDVAPCV
ncbi:unnamed protein product [Chondrus crispus]|uniref:BHLH domain-containing protein n=1 Tax=Chondrus crispus TaxID=2769 RepID=R7QSV5_CHOCR|nr:unnamed protein product [Chondrus crispus]CDF40818.1 unnamed protein product [Chondrus crispus]|eukprot:XP_005711112.1 unnamed protein product [Chondrus crispus]